VFEVSDNNGASWQTLVIAAAGLGVAPLPGNIAYTDKTNVFSPIQFMPALFLNAANPIVLRPGYDGAADTMDVVSGDQQRWGITRSGSFYSMLGGTNLGDLTVRGATNFQGGLNVSAGNLTSQSIISYGSIQSTAPVYPAGGVTAGPQSSWYFGAHSSYGIYCNTGIYIESAIWPYYIEARAHVRAAGGLYDYARGTPIGVWTDFAPQIGGGTLTANYACRYMVVGKTMFVSLYINVATNNGTSFYIVIPLGLTCDGAVYCAAPISFADNQTVGNGMLQCTPGGNVINVYKNVIGSMAWQGTTNFIGQIAIPLNG
jgi:hypothetical protein